MEVIHARCAGLDVHKNTVMACVRTPVADGGRTSTPPGGVGPQRLLTDHRGGGQEQPSHPRAVALVQHLDPNRAI